MGKALDFNTAVRPTLALTMKDEDKTVIRVCLPNQALIEQLEAAAGELTEIMGKRDRSTINALWNLAADLISCNMTGLSVTARDLQDVYNLGLDDMILFYGAYFDFVQSVKLEKNSRSRTTR